MVRPLLRYVSCWQTKSRGACVSRRLAIFISSSLPSIHPLPRHGRSNRRLTGVREKLEVWAWPRTRLQSSLLIITHHTTTSLCQRRRRITGTGDVALAWKSRPCFHGHVSCRLLRHLPKQLLLAWDRDHWERFVRLVSPTEATRLCKDGRRAEHCLTNSTIAHGAPTDPGPCVPISTPGRGCIYPTLVAWGPLITVRHSPFRPL
jgi:hypothetical protein